MAEPRPELGLSSSASTLAGAPVPQPVFLDSERDPQLFCLSSERRLTKSKASGKKEKMFSGCRIGDLGEVCVCGVCGRPLTCAQGKVMVNRKPLMGEGLKRSPGMSSCSCRRWTGDQARSPDARATCRGLGRWSSQGVDWVGYMRYLGIGGVLCGLAEGSQAKSGN